MSREMRKALAEEEPAVEPPAEAPGGGPALESLGVAAAVILRLITGSISVSILVPSSGNVARVTPPPSLRFPGILFTAHPNSLASGVSFSSPDFGLPLSFAAGDLPLAIVACVARRRR